ncbi:MAG: glycoside hydrolase family 38 N-terminal domain-containing protein [Saccharofermentanales bacterium]
MDNKKFFCVISHTHWDREWYMPFEQFRVRLVELMDRLFAIIDQYPGYIFHLDAQTIVLEDYLEIRPWRRELLMKLIAQGNILVGPWYLQNDFYLTSGEATIRNLLVGTRLASDFGKCTKVGYAPDQFGNISQLPQILNQFGVDNFIFGRGYGRYLTDGQGSYLKDENGNPIREKAPTEFIWEGPDGSQLLAVHMKYWYNNAQRIYADTDAAVAFMAAVENSFKAYATTPYLLLMNGVDHLEAQDDLIPVIQAIDGRLPDGSEILQCSMGDYLSKIRSYMAAENLTLHTRRGELRDGHDWEILQGTLSSRVYLKQQNCRAQTELESVLEPMASMYELAGASGSYDNDYFRYLWKQLLKNHPHDSICGCSRDEVHDHMEDNYAKLKEVSAYLESKKSADIAAHAWVNTKNAADNIICLINTISTDHTGVIEAEAVFLSTEHVAAFTIADADGEPVDFVVTSVEERRHDVFTALNLPGVLDVKVFRMLLFDQGTKGFSVKGLKVVPADRFPENQLQTGVCAVEAADFPITIRNEHISVTVSRQGGISLEFAADGRVIENAVRIEEMADRGDAYVYATTDDQPLYVADFPMKAAILEFKDLRTTARIEYAMEVPAEYDSGNNRRSDRTVACPVALTFTLDRGCKVLKLSATVDNNAKDHRIRLLVDTGILSSVSFADIPFDIVEHAIQPEYPLTKSNVHPNTSFAGIEDGQGGIAVLTYGNHEYEQLAAPGDAAGSSGSVLALTLVRGNQFIMVGSDGRSGGGPQWDVPGNQCLRTVTGDFGILAFNGDKALLANEALAFRAPPKAVFASCDTKKFAGGRFAMQGSTLDEFYYLPDLHPALVIPDNKPVVGVKGTGILVTALKKSYDGEAFILRLVNMSESTQSASIEFEGNVFTGSMNEEVGAALPPSGADAAVRVTLRAKEIATFILMK